MDKTAALSITISEVPLLIKYQIHAILFILILAYFRKNTNMWLQHMNDKERYKLHADFCKFMANPKRIEILFLLGEQELCVEEITEKMGINIPNVSQHLSIMRERGLVETRRKGTKIYYRIANTKTLQACLIMRDAMIEQMEKNYKLIQKI